MRIVVLLCLAANNILPMRKEITLFSFLLSLLRENGRSLRFPKIFLKKKQTNKQTNNQTKKQGWSNDKTIMELGYRKI